MCGEKGQSVYFPQFCEIKTALKKLILLKKSCFKGLPNDMDILMLCCSMKTNTLTV